MPGESPVEALVREVREEIGVAVRTPEDRGVLEFVYAERPEWTTRCSIFVATGYDGEPAESDEMQPRWFALDRIPWTEMWESDRLWFPRLLAGERVGYRLSFDSAVRLVSHVRL